jgi:hypothetical protein
MHCTEPPLSAAILMSPVYRMLHSLAAPAFGGGR